MDIKTLKKFAKTVSITLCVIGVVAAISTKYRVVFPVTESLDGKLYFVVMGNVRTLKKGDVVFFEPPENPFYKIKFLKKVGGLPGDKIKVRDSAFYVNGKHCCDHAQILPEASNGTLLYPNDNIEVGADEFLAFGDHARSFDSRYKRIGNLKQSSIVGKGYKLF